jgi:hypothetical protein
MGLSLPFSWVLPGLALAAAWVLAARGYGRMLEFALFAGAAAEEPAPPRRHAAPGTRTALAIGLGMAFMLAAASLLGSVGALRTGLGWRLAEWALIAVGAGAGLVRRDHGDAGDRFLRPWRLAWPSLAAVALLALAAALPPGLAWSTEFGGYDALSYHLQLPKQWLELGRVQPLRDSVYSAFPGFAESGTLQLWTLGSFAPAHFVAGAAQWMHASIAVAAALVTGVLAAALLPANAPPRARAWATGIGAAAVLGIPWVTVTGSLAYNDMAPVLFLATAMLARIAGSGRTSGAGRTGIAVGLALGAAVGSKLTALGMVVVPFAAWAAVAAAPGDRHRLARGALFAAPAASAVLLPWILRNWATIGNPLFPFVGDAPGWWTAEQLVRFAAGHAAAPGTGLDARLAALWTHGFTEGMGPAPGPDPWLPQWGLAFGAGGVAIVASAVRVPRAGIALAAAFAAQCAFWMLATHLKARFLLPCAVPLCAAMGIALAPRAAVAVGAMRTATAGVLTAFLLAWSAQPWIVARMDPRMSGPNGAWALCDTLGSGVALLGPGTQADADALAATGDPMPLAWIANWRLPPGAVLGCEGEADVFWCRSTPAWGTVWDGGPLARALRAHPDDPDAAVSALRAEGLTHLAIGEAMLSRWKDAGWLDPALEPARVRAVAARLRPLAPLASGGTLYAIPSAAQP